MNSVKETIEKYNLIKKEEIIGVALSGGSDSMALLHTLHKLSADMEFEVVAIHINHKIREESYDEERFVMRYCKENHIRAYKFHIDCPKLAKDQGKSLETAARDARIGVFESLIKKGIVDKVAIAHHMSDQAETILLHIFRGAGLSGAKGMEISSKDGMFIRPLLETTKEEIQNYISLNDIPYVEDASNEDCTYTRNHIRNKIMPLILEKWPNAVESLNSFAQACTEDDEYINSSVHLEASIIDDKLARIPNTYFLNANSIVSRMIFKVLRKIGVNQDIEKKHIDLIKDLAINGKNGSKLTLPNSLFVYKEYDYVAFINKYKPPVSLSMELKTGEFELDGIGKLIVKKVRKFDKENVLYIDCAKTPKNVMWRLRENGDVFEKFGGGTKKLKDYLIDKKVPARLRAFLPILALENEVYAIAGVEISNKVRLDQETKSAYMIEFIQE